MDVLILVVVEDGLVQALPKTSTMWVSTVLILVVVEDGLVLRLILFRKLLLKGLNPCCSGRWSRTILSASIRTNAEKVLILVVVEDGLVHYEDFS